MDPSKPVVGKMTTFDLWPLPLGGGARGAGKNMWHPETPATYESLPAPLATQILTLWIHKFGGGGVGGALILDRCRAFDLFESVDAHLCSKPYWCPPVWVTLTILVAICWRWALPDSLDTGFSTPSGTCHHLMNWFNSLIVLKRLQGMFHQIRLDWKWYRWISLGEYNDRRWQKDCYILPTFFVISVILEVLQPAQLCMQWANSAGNIAAGAIILTNIVFSEIFSVFREILKDLFHVTGTSKHQCYSIWKGWLPHFVSALKWMQYAKRD